LKEVEWKGSNCFGQISSTKINNCVLQAALKYLSQRSRFKKEQQLQGFVITPGSAFPLDLLPGQRKKQIPSLRYGMTKGIYVMTQG